MKETKKLLELEKKIGYKFENFDLLVNALTHSSYANEHHIAYRGNNERLEFLGDAVLEVTSSEFLFRTYPELPEGELTKKRASLVCEPTLALCAREIPLGDYLLLGKGEEATGGRSRDSVVSDAMEALIGAIYLDGGFANAKEFIHKYILNDIENKQLFYDSKTTLQEIVQGRYEEDVHYVLIKEEGPDHNKSFYVEALLGERVLGQGCGHTKKAAEQQAAYCAIKKLKNEKGDICI
ncbi:MULTISPECIES: ribonuclease III [Blautia]|uniref:Ribonuclease 3 n=1 Tax=Blautia argi TaxID=1912897 RepID=A0A2Z4UAX6_9FIRM|nr:MULTISPECIES: ribonuclease III [Blautia]AWY98166.1 ribonuclease III [Blautia argi]